jgi:hypothetical protein
VVFRRLYTGLKTMGLITPVCRSFTATWLFGFRVLRNSAPAIAANFVSPAACRRPRFRTVRLSTLDALHLKLKPLAEVATVPLPSGEQLSSLFRTDTASMLCRDEDEVRQKARALELTEHPGKRVRVDR